MSGICLLIAPVPVYCFSITFGENRRTVSGGLGLLASIFTEYLTKTLSYRDRDSFNIAKGYNFEQLSHAF